MRLRVRDLTDHLGWLDQVYGSNLKDAPVLSFPRGNRTTASVAQSILKGLDWRKDFVVQYVTRNSETRDYPHLKGKLSTLVAFYDFSGNVWEYINPNGKYEMDMNQWPDVAPLREAYRFVDPPELDEAIDPNWRTIVSTGRGRLAPLGPHVYEAIKGLEVEPIQNLYRSETLLKKLGEFEAIAGPSFLEITMSRSTSRAGWVYALALKAYPELMKIGHSANVDYRRAQLSTAVPEEFTVIDAKFFEDRIAAEKAMHAELKACWHVREWFRCDPQRLQTAFDSVAAKLGGRG